MQEKQIRVLLEVKNKIASLILLKQNQLSELEKEIQDLSEISDQLDSLISSSSFQTADSLLSSNPEIIDAETAANQNSVNMENLNYTQKIFSVTGTDLLAIMDFKENFITIQFPSPQSSRITQERYINDFVKPTLVQLKKVEPDLSPEILKSIYQGQEFLTKITLRNVKSFESFEFIAEKIKKNLLNEKS
ncbi:MAG: hypothetical protein ACTSWL_05115 [Promethearchaeota archaeon]